MGQCHSYRLRGAVHIAIRGIDACGLRDGHPLSVRFCPGYPCYSEAPRAEHFRISEYRQVTCSIWRSTRPEARGRPLCWEWGSRHWPRSTESTSSDTQCIAAGDSRTGSKRIEPPPPSRAIDRGCLVTVWRIRLVSNVNVH